MTISELHANEELRRHEFPVVRDTVYLGHAGVCALPRRVVDAMNAYLAEATCADQEDALPATLFLETRALAASLLQAQPAEIALVGPTSLPSPRHYFTL